MADEPSKLDDLLEQLASIAGDSKEKQRAIALKLLDSEGTKAIGEVLLKKGLSKRAADATGKASELEAEAKRLADELAEAKAQIKELEAKEPNWNRRLESEQQKWERKLAEAEAKVNEERSISLADKVNIERQKFNQALRVGQPGGVDELVGKYLPAEYRDSFVPDPETRSVKVRELGETDSYYDPAEGDPAEQLARDVIAKLDPKARIVGDPEPGGGVNGGRVIDKQAAAVIAAKRRDPLYSGF